MAMLQWTEKMSVGVDSIDRQHQKLIAIINRIIDLVLANQQREMAQITDELLLYAKEHFDFEEQLFTRYQYAETEAHIAQHERLRVGLVSQIDLYRRNELQPGELLVFLKDWLIKHIMETDMRYSALLKSHRVN